MDHMEQIIQKLLATGLLSEETRAELTSEWETSVQQIKAGLRETVEAEVRAELAEAWTAEREALSERIDNFVEERLQEEIKELKSDVESFRDLEAEFAGRAVANKEELATQLAEEIDTLIDKLDAFLEARLSEEIQELKEDLDFARQNNFGRRIFEAFMEEYNASHVDENSALSKLAIAESKLQDATALLEQREQEVAALERAAKLEKVLSPLAGAKRQQMEFILSNVDTARLEETYNTFVGRVLKEDSTVQQSSTPTSAPVVGLTESTLVTGELSGTQTVTPNKVSDGLSALRRLAGINA